MKPKPIAGRRLCPRRYLRSAALLLSAFAAITSHAQGLPDLIINRGRIINSLEIQWQGFSPDDCAIVEDCVRGTGRRALLLFDTAIANIGGADLFIGSPDNNPLFEFSPCHGHYHFRALVSYDLLTIAGKPVARGLKQSFCLTDTVRYTANAPRSSGFDCHWQGLTRGWEDVYVKGLDCQWFDITGVPAGTYDLRISVNLERYLHESNYGNNTVIIPIRLYRYGRTLKVAPVLGRLRY